MEPITRGSFLHSIDLASNPRFLCKAAARRDYSLQLTAQNIPNFRHCFVIIALQIQVSKTDSICKADPLIKWDAA
jgi:hypothetical protein